MLHELLFHLHFLLIVNLLLMMKAAAALTGGGGGGVAVAFFFVLLLFFFLLEDVVSVCCFVCLFALTSLGFLSLFEICFEDEFDFDFVDDEKKTRQATVAKVILKPK